ncbi:MAG: DUF4404 family protein [Candidatus Binatia bacterium]
MIEDTLKKIEARVQAADTLAGDPKVELLQLLSTLHFEVAELAKTHGEHAESIASFAEASTREATRTQRNPRLLELSLAGLSSSVEEFEQSHPRLVEIANAISNALASLGI